MPMYEYKCVACNRKFEQIEPVRKGSWKSAYASPVCCKYCEDGDAYPIVSEFKVGTRILETSGKTGYEDDDLTIGKLVDEGGIPAETKRKLAKRERMQKRQKEYTEGLKARAKKYKFDPFSQETAVKA